MSHFYADIQGNRGPATRQGSKESGIHGHIRGWNLGGKVSMREFRGRDIVTLTLTAGSNGQRPDLPLVEIMEGPETVRPALGINYLHVEFLRMIVRYIEELPEDDPRRAIISACVS